MEDEVFITLVSIKNRGKGIDPDILPRLFTKFTTKSSRGIGLGLYLAKGIIVAHGGKFGLKINIMRKTMPHFHLA